MSSRRQIANWRPIDQASARMYIDCVVAVCISHLCPHRLSAWAMATHHSIHSLLYKTQTTTKITHHEMFFSFFFCKFYYFYVLCVHLVMTFRCWRCVCLSFCLNILSVFVLLAVLSSLRYETHWNIKHTIIIQYRYTDQSPIHDTWKGTQYSHIHI